MSRDTQTAREIIDKVMEEEISLSDVFKNFRDIVALEICNAYDKGFKDGLEEAFRLMETAPNLGIARFVISEKITAMATRGKGQES